MVVSTATFITDLVLFIRDTLRTNITDPISSKRKLIDKFVHTAYPKRAVQYPVITVKSAGMDDIKLGMRSEQRWINIRLEVRIWARNTKERDILTQQIINHLRDLQYTDTTGSNDNNIFDFNLNSAVDVDEDGQNTVLRSKVMEIQYNVILS